MNILYVAQWAGSDKHGMVYGHYHLARQWVKAGHSVTIISSSFSHTRHTQPDAGWFKSECIDGIRYIWVPVNVYDSRSSVGRLVSIIFFSFLCFFVRHHSRTDVVISSSHHPLSIFYSLFIAKLHSAKLIYEIRDLWPLSLIELGGYSQRNPAIILMGLVERFAYKVSDRIVGTLEKGFEHISVKGIEGKYIYLPNGAVPFDGAGEELQVNLSNVFSDGRFVISYCGNLGVANNLYSFIESAKYLPEDKYIFLLVGSGPESARLKAQAQKFNNVFFFPRTSRSEVSTILRKSNLAFLSYSDRPLYRYGISPTKLGDYASAAVPVLFSADFDLGELEGVEGLFRCADAPASIASAIKKIAATDFSVLKKKSLHFSRWYFNGRSYDNIASKYLNVMRQIKSKG